MKIKVVWEKYEDPIITGGIFRNESNLEEEEEIDGDDEELDSIERAMQEDKPETRLFPVMKTPFGALVSLNSFLASDKFDFWVMHTNFDITESMARVIESVPGVETLEVYTRYRARVGFPKSGLFKPREVMHNIHQKCIAFDRYKQDMVLDGITYQELIERIKNIRDDLDNKYEYWCMLILPNGNIETSASNDNSKTHINRASLLKETSILVGGRFLTSENDI